MLKAAHDDTTKGVILLVLLIECLSAANGAVEAFLVLEAVHILCAVRVDVLQALCKLIVKAVDEADDTAANENNAVLLCLR